MVTNSQIKTKIDKRESDSDDVLESVLNYGFQDECLPVIYSAEDIKEFLRTTKWQKMSWKDISQTVNNLFMMLNISEEKGFLCK